MPSEKIEIGECLDEVAGHGGRGLISAAWTRLVASSVLRVVICSGRCGCPRSLTGGLRSSERETVDYLDRRGETAAAALEHDRSNRGNCCDDIAQGIAFLIFCRPARPIRSRPSAD